jgi:hypothetical protein
MKPSAIDTSSVIPLLLYTAAEADQRPDIFIFVFVIEGAGIFKQDNDPTRRISVAPHLVAIDPHESVVEIVKTVIHEGDIANHNAPGAIDIDVTEGLNREAREPKAVEGRMHPVSPGDVEPVTASLDYAGWHGRRVNILNHAR